MAPLADASVRKQIWSERGSAAIDAGDLAGAERCFREAIRADKRNGRHHFHLALVLEARAKFGPAVEHLTQALRLNPVDADAARRLTSLISRRPIPADAQLDPTGIKAALHHDTSATWLITKLALHQLKRGTLGSALAMGKRDGWPEAARALCLRKTADILKDELFLEILRTNIVRDPDVEYLLTAVRCVLLLDVPLQRLEDRDLCKFAIAMMHQCRANEYVWYVTDAEQARLASEIVSLSCLQEGDIAEGRKFLLVSLYKSLCTTLGKEADPRAFAKVRPKDLREALLAHMTEDSDLHARKAKIPKLGVICDEISRKVALQYERNPYPRWTSLSKPAPGEERKRLGGFFKPSQLAFMDRTYDILVAGCGTGHSAVYTALSSPNARVTAVDLSTSALAYGSRMAERYGTKNVGFLQADIKLLSTFGSCFASRFQIIECVGALHHMADPFESWRTLLDCLAPGGIMLIGLYSAMARRVVTELRGDVAFPGAACDDAALRNFRRRLMDRSGDELGCELKLGPDFYTTSEFRDLACHVHERCVTLSEIRNFLDANSLAFRGFWLDPRQLDYFHEKCPGEPWPGRLEVWEEFEQENPQIFSGMYHFWCERQTR